MSNPEKYTSHLLNPPGAYFGDTTGWWIAPIIAALPAFVVGLLAGLAPEWTDQIRTAALVLAACALGTWRGVTKRFAGLPLSTALAIAAIVGAAVAMIAGISADSAPGFGVRFVCGLVGALQGGAAAWFIAAPYEAPPEVEAEGEHEIEEDTPNPPTSPP